MKPDYHCISKGKGAEVRIQRKTFKSKELIDIRIWFQPRGQTEFLPTGKGVSLAAEDIGKVIQALEDCSQPPLLSEERA